MKKIINIILLAGLLANATAFANAPAGLQLGSAAGAAITTSSAHDATIRQTEFEQILDWPTLNLNNGELVKFNQSGNGDWSTLNVINSTSTNSIFGKIKQEGSLYLFNPNGVLFPEGNATFGCTSGFSISTSNGLTIGCTGDLVLDGGFIKDDTKISLIGGSSISLRGGISLIAPQVELQSDSIGDHPVLASDPISLSGLRGAGVFYSGEFLVRPYIPEKVVDTSLGGSISLGGSTPLILAVPEPSTYLMMLLGLVGIVGVARRKA